TGLDTGAITLTGPNGLDVTLGPQLGIKGAFFSQLSDSAIPSTGGSFTFKGSGGADVGSFTSTLNLSNPLINWTNQSAVTNIDRSSSLTITWTGGNPGSYVFVSGTSSVTGNGSPTITGFTCLAKADDGQFTIPSMILSAMVPGAGAVQVQ